MDTHRITLTIQVDLDSVPGTMHTRASAEKTIQGILDNTIPHYNPIVES